jgi:hypothetical protein
MMSRIVGDMKRRIGFNPLAWPGFTRRMKAQVADFQTQSPKAGQPHFGVVVTPWVGTAVPWYSLAIGMLLAADGARVTFLFDDLPFGDSMFRYRYIRRCISTVLDSIKGRHEVIQLSRVASTNSIDSTARKSIQRLARLNAVWQMRGEIVDKGRLEHIALYEKQISAAHGPISRVVQSASLDVLFVPGGVFGTTGIWTETARAAGIRIASYDTGGYETVMLATNGIACQLQDIPDAFRRLMGSCDEAELTFAVRSAYDEMARRRSGTDTFSSQMKSDVDAGREFDGAVLIALNSSWDSAALGLHAVFDDNTHWILETVRTLLEFTDVPVIVRQHPAERLEFARTSDDYGELLRSHFGAHPRLRFIAAAEPVNSYALLDQVAAVITYTSTVGIEAAAVGRPVITPSNAYYASLGFVWRAGSEDEYKRMLIRAATGDLAVTDAMRREAAVCYYLTQCCNWIFTQFNPADFSKWSKRDLATLHADPKVRRILYAVRENVPAAHMNHVERWNAAKG